MKNRLCCLLVLCVNFLQASNPKFFIGFTDKNNSPYSLGNPSAYLSAKALARRATRQIQINPSDLPVNPAYIDSVAARGALILNTTRWLNGVTVECDSITLALIQALPFVQSTVHIKRLRGTRRHIDKFPVPSPAVERHTGMVSTQSFSYGDSYNQIHLMNGEYLHNLGYTGRGMTIALLDAGFYQADINPVFDSARAGNQILGTWDFVANEAGVYEDDSHGAEVLSCIAGNVPGQLVGTAPHASFWLLRSEDAPTEYKIEEYNWVSAAEFADSAGADIISSSLGYSTFDDSTMDHTFADMDGHTCPSSVGANFAFSKGMLVLVSAGNLGNSPWHYISAPADGDSVLAVGAVDSSGFKAYFSSFGPASDGDIKPNVAAKGLEATLSYSDGTIGPGSGTSFSCPILAGSAACLWQAHPDKSNREIFDAIERSANYYSNPGDSLGYGIPDFMLADTYLGGTILNLSNEDNLLAMYPNPFIDEIEMQFYSGTAQTIKIQVTDVTGRIISGLTEEVRGGSVNRVVIHTPAELSNGIYLVDIRSKEKSFLKKVVKL